MKTICRVFLLIAASIVLAVGVLPIGVFRSVPSCPLFGPFDEHAARSGLLFSLATVSGLYLLFEIVLASRSQRKRGTSGFVILALLLSDLFLANTWMLTTMPVAERSEGSPLPVEMRAEGATPIRIYRFPIWYPDEFETLSSPDRLAEARRWDRASLFPRYPLPRRLAVIDVRGTLLSKDYYPLAGRIRSELKYGDFGQAERQLERLGVQYVVAPKNAALDAEPVDAKPDWPEDVSFWKLRNPRRFDYVVYEPNRLVFDVDLSEAETVVLSEQYWPGWRAFVEKREIPVRCVEEVFRGVDLPSGKHRVTMIYDPPLFKLGVILSALGLLAAILLSLLKPLRRRGRMNGV